MVLQPYGLNQIPRHRLCPPDAFSPNLSPPLVRSWIGKSGWQRRISLGPDQRAAQVCRGRAGSWSRCSYVDAKRFVVVCIRPAAPRLQRWQCPGTAGLDARGRRREGGREQDGERCSGPIEQQHDTGATSAESILVVRYCCVAELLRPAVVGPRPCPGPDFRDLNSGEFHCFRCLHSPVCSVGPLSG